MFVFVYILGAFIYKLANQICYLHKNKMNSFTAK